MNAIALQAKTWRGISDFLTEGSRAVSNISKAVDKYSSETLIHATEPVSSKSLRQKADADLANIYYDCSVENWDDDGAIEITAGVIVSTLKFLRALPDSQLPEIGPDPQGEILLSWYKGDEDVFSVSIGENSRVAFAGLFGESEVRGQEHLENGNIPIDVSQYIQRIS